MAWTDPRTWADGELVTASMMNTHVRDNLNGLSHLLVRKPSDESVVSNTTFQADDHLLAPVAANEIWQWQWRILQTGGSTGDIKYRFTFPTGGVLVHHAVEFDPGGAITIFTASTGTSPTGQLSMLCGGVTPPLLNIIDVTYTNGANAGNVTLEWAQNTSDATASIVRTNSTLWGVRIA